MHRTNKKEMFGVALVQSSVVDEYVVLSAACTKKNLEWYLLQAV